MISLTQVYAYMAGCLSILLLSPLMRWLAKQMSGDYHMRETLYGLHHAILNIDVPPKSMWMNMGYWDKSSDAPTACSRLLHEVLNFADLIDEDGYRTGRWPIKLLDLGFGCGDQTIEIMQNFPSLISSYIGITIDTTQYNFAHQRLSSLCLLQGSSSPTDKPFSEMNQAGSAELNSQPIHQTALLDKMLEFQAKESKDIRIFCADAAQPDRWNLEIKEAIRPNIAKQLREQSSMPPLSKLSKQETWVLGLNTLYHFSPSRQPIFNYAYQKLQASIMAFDLLLGEDATMLQRWCTRIIASLMGSPMGNFMTVSEYKKELLKAGYEEEKVEIKDVSEYVFKGLAEFLEKRDQELETYLGRGIGGYKVFGWLLKWWERSGVVRGSIIVAKI